MRALNNLALLLQERKDYEAALPLMERSLAIREEVYGDRSPFVAFGLNNLAGLLDDMGHTERAIPMYERCLEIRIDALGPNHPLVANTLFNLAVVLEGKGDVEAARSLFDRSLRVHEVRLDLLDTLSEREGIAYIATSRRVVDNWLVAFDRVADNRVAWSTAIRWKGVATRRIRARTTASRLDPTARDLHEQLGQTRAEIARITFAEVGTAGLDRAERLDKLTLEKESIERELAIASVAWRGQQTLEAAGESEICAALPEGVALVDFLRYRGRYLAFVVTSPDCHVHRIELGKAAGIDRAVGEWRAALVATKPLTPTFRIDRRGAVVWQQVWEPLLDALGTAHRVVVVPDSSLSALPFPALPTGKGRYLLEEMPIEMLESAQDLLRRPASVGSGALLVGDVDFQVAGEGGLEKGAGTRSAPCVNRAFESLDATADEIGALGRRWARGRYRREHALVLSGQNASETRVHGAMAGRRVVHLATHGFFASEDCQMALVGSEIDGQPTVLGHNPMLLSGVVLAGVNAEHQAGDPQDGILTAEELGSLDLRGTELVVLSACETGLGVSRAGEGVMGLRRAFAIAGAEHLVMSLWAVSDVGTAQLMEGFYGRWLHRRQPLTPADAMRAAQLEMLAAQRELGMARPDLWGAFVVAGWSPPHTK